MKKIFFVVNSPEEFRFEKYLKEYLSETEVNIGESLPEDTSAYDLIILWSLRRILKDVEKEKNIILFHSTDLPDGKGWAPIYNTVAKGKENYVISGIRAANKVDSGEIVMKAVFKMKPSYTAPKLREWDVKIMFMMIQKLLEHMKPGEALKGAPQQGEETYNQKRKKEDNEIFIDAPLKDVMNHLRACEASHPAFFIYKGVRYNIMIEPETVPEFPEDLEIIFY